MSTEPEAIASSMGGPEVKSDQFTLNGSVLSRPAAFSTASAPVPFWSPTFSVTEDRLTDELGLADAVEAAAADEKKKTTTKRTSSRPRPARRWR